MPINWLPCRRICRPGLPAPGKPAFRPYCPARRLRRPGTRCRRQSRRCAAGHRRPATGSTVLCPGGSRDCSVLRTWTQNTKGIRLKVSTKKKKWTRRHFLKLNFLFFFLSLRYSMPMRRSRKCIQDCSSLNGWSVGTSRTGPRSSSSNTVGTHKKRNWNKRNEWKWWPMGFQWIQSMEECFLILPAGFLLIKVKSFWKKRRQKEVLIRRKRVPIKLRTTLLIRPDWRWRQVKGLRPRSTCGEC